MVNIAMFDIRYEIKNAGPSPHDNRRTELYFAGCDKAASGNPCKNCFNPMIWQRDKALVKSAQDFLDCLNKHNIPRFITLVGGEPTDQLDGLVEFGRLAKADGYHIILFSWHDVEWLKAKLGDAVCYFDIIIPGEYLESRRIYDESKDDGLHNMVGSRNQYIWLPKEGELAKAADLSSLALNKERVLEVTYSDGSKKYFQQ